MICASAEDRGSSGRPSRFNGFSNGRKPGNARLMSETKNPGDHTLSVSPTKTLSLKRPVEAGIVRQSFSHGRKPGNARLMSETKNPGDHTLSVSPTKTLSLKRPVEAGIVRQSFSHGRS